nr:MAG TPA: hypothetical protein [Caudoviricetes sp.]DAJ13288.1 MAG TPA: hypothetical protein [Siphoviridae sp. ctX8T1]
MTHSDFLMEDTNESSARNKCKYVFLVCLT